MIEDIGTVNEQKQEKNETQPIVMECFQHLPSVPVQTDPSGVKFDFNAGLRIQLPDDGKAYHCLIVDADENNIIHDAVMAPDNRFQFEKILCNVSH